METKELYSIWKETFTNEKNENITHCFNKIVEAYQGSVRHYHNLHHIGVLLKQINEADLLPREQLILTYAAFFHDVVYIPGNKANELKSSVFANVWLNQLPVAYDLIHPVCAVIEATSNHIETKDKLCQLFLDMDLSILASDTDIYDKYSQNIRKEHYYIPNFFFTKGRKKFLTNTLIKPFIFHTEEYQVKHEQNARRNLYRELKNLEA